MRHVGPLQERSETHRIRSHENSETGILRRVVLSTSTLRRNDERFLDPGRGPRIRGAMMKAILKCSGRTVDVEPIPGDARHMIVFGSVFIRTVWDVVGLRPVHIVAIDKLEFAPVSEMEAPVACRG
jgi:hypothetical protein